MKYENKERPLREVWFKKPRLVGTDKVRMEMHYSITSKHKHTWVTQPVEFTLCEMRRMGGWFHDVLNELEDQLTEAREHMKGSR